MKRGPKAVLRHRAMHLGIEVQLTPTHVALLCRSRKATPVHIPTLLLQDRRSPHSRRRRRDCDNAALAKPAHRLVIRRTPSDLEAHLLSIKLRHGCHKRVPQCADVSAPRGHFHHLLPTFPRRCDEHLLLRCLFGGMGKVGEQIRACLGKTCRVRSKMTKVTTDVERRTFLPEPGLKPFKKRTRARRKNKKAKASQQMRK